MITTTITWYEPTEKLPEKTGHVLIKTAGIHHVYYSSKHKLFNALDCETEAEAKETAITPLVWAEVPAELPEWKERRNNGKFEFK